MEEIKQRFPEVQDVECPYCGEENDISGDEFEKSLNLNLYAIASERPSVVSVGEIVMPRKWRVTCCATGKELIILL